MAMFNTLDEFNEFIKSSPTGKEDKITGEMIVDWCQVADKIDWLRSYRENHPRINLYALRKEFYKNFFPERAGKPVKKGLGCILMKFLKDEKKGRFYTVPLFFGFDFLSYSALFASLAKVLSMF